jgi:succinate dehydrogenase/fumarate reductase flavoprotein subunit
MSDLTEKLRDGIPAYDVMQDGTELHDIDAAETLMAEAADEIDRLRELLLKEAGK